MYALVYKRSTSGTSSEKSVWMTFSVLQCYILCVRLTFFLKIPSMISTSRHQHTPVVVAALNTLMYRMIAALLNMSSYGSVPQKDKNVIVPIVLFIRCRSAPLLLPILCLLINLLVAALASERPRDKEGLSKTKRERDETEARGCWSGPCVGQHFT